MPVKLAVVVSGGGSNLQSIIDKIEAGLLDAEIKVVLSNNPEAFGIERAKRHGIETRAWHHKDFPSREAFDKVLAEGVRESGADTVALAGYMRLLTPGFLESFPNHVINIHPALLPSFPGVHGQGDAAAYGVKVSGCTVHFVDEKMDHGPVIIQAVVPVMPGEDGDTLGKRILALEHRIYPQALQWFSQGRLSLKGRHVHIEGVPGSLSGEGFFVNPGLEPGF